MKTVAQRLRIEGGVMARQTVIQVTCSRCTRVEHRPMSEVHLLKNPTLAFVGSFKGEKAEFDDLCVSCEDIVLGHWKGITKRLVKMSPTKKKDE